MMTLRLKKLKRNYLNETEFPQEGKRHATYQKNETKTKPETQKVKRTWIQPRVRRSC